MGVIESRVRKSIRRSKVNRAVIAGLAVAGTLALVAIAPNAAGVLGKMLTPQRKQNIKRSLSRLVANGYVALEETSTGKKRARLTPKGERYAALLGEGKLAPKKPKRWDGKWRMLVFDIPERRRKVRDQTRLTLVNLGFLRLQDSVWVYPYDCEDLITLFKTDFRIGKDLLYVVADAIEHDGPLRGHFGV